MIVYGGLTKKHFLNDFTILDISSLYIFLYLFWIQKDRFKWKTAEIEELNKFGVAFHASANVFASDIYDKVCIYRNFDENR